MEINVLDVFSMIYCMQVEEYTTSMISMYSQMIKALELRVQCTELIN